MMAGVKFAIIPFKGGNTQITATLAGDIPLGNGEHQRVAAAPSQWQYQDPRADERAAGLSFAPELPTIAETFPGFDLGIWQSIVAPAGTPRDIIDKLSASLKKVLASPDVRDKLLIAGIEPVNSNTPEEFAAFIRSQAETRAKVIQAVGMKLD